MFGDILVFLNATFKVKTAVTILFGQLFLKMGFFSKHHLVTLPLMGYSVRLLIKIITFIPPTIQSTTVYAGLQCHLHNEIHLKHNRSKAQNLPKNKEKLFTNLMIRLRLCLLIARLLGPPEIFYIILELNNSKKPLYAL